MIEKLQSAVQKRALAKFFPKAHIRFELYDCVTFALDIYQELGILPQDSEFPDYDVYTRGDEMLKKITTWVEDSGAFTEVDQVSPGCLLVATKGLRGHHVGLAVEEDLVVHCCRLRNVSLESYSTGVFGPNIHKIYKPHGME